MDEEKDNGNSSDRPKVQGNWTCADCGVEITELPFQPKEGQPVTCKECWLKKRNARRGEMVQGNWKCSGCGTTITELPFNPRKGGKVFCRDCYRSQRG